MEKRIIYPPLSDRFEKFGDKFEKMAHNPVNGMYCYQTDDGHGFGILRGVQGSEMERQRRDGT